MNKIAEWWWAHEAVRVIVSVIVGAVACYAYVWYTWVWQTEQEERERIRRWYEREYGEWIAFQASLEELNRKLESGELS